MPPFVASNSPTLLDKAPVKAPERAPETTPAVPPDNPVAVADRQRAVGLVMYLATQPDYIAIHDIHKDPMSGFAEHEEIKAAMRAACDVLDVKAEEGKVTLYRLPRTLDGYRDVFAFLRDTDDVYNFLSSVYSQAVVTEPFIRDALLRWATTPYYQSLAARYPAEQVKPGEAMVTLMAQQPGFKVLATMFWVSPAVVGKLLFPEKLSRYELTHPKITLDLAFAADMVRRAPPGTVLSVKYEIIAQGMVNLQESGGSGIP